MAYRGHGRGRGGYGGGGGFGFAKEEPFELFPEIELSDYKNVPVERNLILWNLRLLNYWKSSPYFLEENVEKKSQSVDIERYSDWNKLKVSSNRGSINQFLQLQYRNVPAELVKDSREVRNPKRVRWNADAGLNNLDLFEKLEKKQGQEDKVEKENKVGEDEDGDNDEAAGEAEEEFSDDGDYNQNIDFDDDEDDFNVDDGNDDEAIY